MCVSIRMSACTSTCMGICMSICAKFITMIFTFDTDNNVREIPTEVGARENPAANALGYTGLPIKYIHSTLRTM